ncbi:Gryzun, putative trafficking through golgi-domain-containing protein [Infundibulicybe gibba]|nr:Gryzun, putative trafficking through golgi-domain-containing protein [Infundibulicybe gibba]
MNSYPPELLAQLAPVMFVGGLDAVPPATPAAVATPTTPTAKTQDAFSTLALRLREALLAQRKVAIWQPEKAKSFQVILVDKDVRFPPRKLVSPEDPQYSAAHSPLSPLTPSSPLYPDGLIAPIWIRKHTTLVPSVFVLFMRIYEYPLQTPRSPLDAPDFERERDREQEERRRDAELSAEVAHRKKSTNERGIKLTVVLMASRRMLDDPSLDARLTYIRKQSGLDSRAALFVLSPVSPAELSDFVNSLQQALYEPALEYYTNHSKRVRRKRNRHSQVVSTYPNPATPLGSPVPARPLRPEGWTVRYEYKMACFAEFRGEDEVALKHYQDAYGMLVIMFGSTAILPPRTKRWAEAKVLADCIDVKVTKLYLYNNEHALALSHHNSHMRKFGDFSRGWGIGEETFEYWSWMARQHRILAELLEQGTRSTLSIPTHKPYTAAGTLSASQYQRGGVHALDSDAMRALGLNPSHALQHPGFYYYMAARCTELRRQRFLTAVDAEQAQQAMALSPGFANEKKVEHLVIILELYTKAYELFKKYSPAGPQGAAQGRLTLWIAYRIAQTYYDSGKFDMAVRFFERIAKTYRREKWGSMLKPLLSTWYACAQQLGDVDLSVRLLIEMLGYDAEDSEDPSLLEEDLLAVLKSTVPSSPDEPLVVDLSESRSIFDSSVIFWLPEVKVGETTAFQLSLTASIHTTITSLPFSSLVVHFSNNISPIVVQHSHDLSSSSVQRVDLGHVSSSRPDASVLQACLRWPTGGTIIFTGTMSSDVPTTLEVTRIDLTIVEGTWKIEIPLSPCNSRQGVAPVARWLSSLSPLRFTQVRRTDPSIALNSVRHRPHNIALSLSHQEPAYLDEEYPITITVTNVDERELSLMVEILLQPSDIDDAINSIVLDDQRSSGLIKGISCGVLAPGVSIVKTLYLISTGAGGDRTVDISVQSRSPTLSPDSQESSDDMTETLQTLVVPVIDPITVTQDVVYRQSLRECPGLADLATYEEEFWDDWKGGEALITTRLVCAGKWGLEVVGVQLEREDGESAKVVESSIDESGDIFPSVFLPGDEFSDISRVSLAPAEDHPTQEPIAGPGKYLINWRRYGLSLAQNGQYSPIFTSAFPLPPLSPPVEGLVALLDAPPSATLHVPFSLSLIIRNHHPSRAANITVHLEPEASDGFVVAGLRSGRLPVLLPGSEEKVTWRLIPLECGNIKIPSIRVADRRKTPATEAQPTEKESDGDLVKIIDIRLDERQVPSAPGVPSGTGEPGHAPHLGTILVLP